MSNREYFSLRYAVPGFVFILVIIGINYNTFFQILTNEGMTDYFGVALSLFSLFAGSAIGFLISQIWFAYFHYNRLYAKLAEPIEEIMEKKFGLIKKGDKEIKKIKKNRDIAFGASIDYLLLNMDKKNKWEFFQRKVDIYHVLSSALVSLLFGTVIGLILRGGTQWILYGKLFSFPEFSNIQTGIDVLVFSFTLVTVIFFVFLLRYLQNEVFFEFYPMFKLLVSNDEFKKKSGDIKALFHEVFPKEFPSED